MGRLVVVLLPTLLVFSGCNLDLGEAPFLCCPDCSPKCPEGYECVGSYCVKDGNCPEHLPGCKTVQDSCGNEKCDNNESCSSCPQDCGQCTECGDGKCEAGEDCTNCALDCGACPQSCGNGNCDQSQGESCSNCPQDCGACPQSCGNGNCDQSQGESCSNCPQDCGQCSTCGDGNCDAGETETSCPQDCSTTPPDCVQDETECDGANSIRFCDAGAWQTMTCDQLCADLQYDYTTGCQFSTNKNKDVCMCGAYGDFGSLCDETMKCDPSLFCGSFEAGKPGFCSKACTNPGGLCTGGPLGSTAECVLDDGQGGYACGFTCDLLSICPAGMACDTAKNLCKPT